MMISDIDLLKNENERLKAELEALKANPRNKEAKTKRLQLLLQPSVYDWLQLEVQAKNTSMNSYVNQLIIEKMDESKQR